MPFTKAGRNRNVSPSGRVFTDKQVKLYYATVFTDKQVKLYYATDGFKKSKLSKKRRRKRKRK
jgi:hypothetical protein